MQILAGVRTAISDNIDVTLKYRFFNVEGLRMVDVGDFKSEKFTFRSHSLLGGITFNFGAQTPPPPPPPPLPPPPPAPPP